MGPKTQFGHRAPAIVKNDRLRELPGTNQNDRKPDIESNRDILNRWVTAMDSGRHTVLHPG
jgi:hypothetical protein